MTINEKRIPTTWVECTIAEVVSPDIAQGPPHGAVHSSTLTSPASTGNRSKSLIRRAFAQARLQLGPGNTFRRVMCLSR
jgi:hypothetical protein